VEATFVAARPVDSINITLIGGDDPGQVSNSNENLKRAMLRHRVSTDVGDEAMQVAERWVTTDGLTARQIHLELNQIANRIADESDRLELATDLERYPIMIALQRLHNNLRTLAHALIASAPKVTTYVVSRPMPLLAIVQQLYGGEDAVRRIAARS